MPRTDYEIALGYECYNGQNERFFDKNGEETMLPSFAKHILIWRWEGQKLGYFPKKF